MSTTSTLLNRLEKREKVYITPSHYFRRWNIVFTLIVLFVLMLDVLIAISFGKTFLSIGLISIVSLVPILFIFYLRKQIRSAYLMGDTLIFKSFDNSSKVTSLRSVRKVNSTSILGLNWTRLEYNLDGMHNSVLIVVSNFNKTNLPEKSLKEAINWSKKRKANHKPGSVAV